MVSSQVIQLLERSGVDYRIHEHPPVTTIDDAHAKVPHLTRNLLKTVVFRIKDADWVLAAVIGRDRIHYKKLADALGVSRRALRTIAPDRVAEDLGYEVGGVGPFAVREEIRVVFDASVSRLGTVFCGSGTSTRTIEIQATDLIGLGGGQVAPICRSRPPAVPRDAPADDQDQSALR